MKQDKEITKVVFLMDKPDEEPPYDVYAFFPEEMYTNNSHSTFMSYAHLGQHSACNIQYAKACKLATPEQYNDLKRELEGIGYNLEITTL